MLIFGANGGLGHLAIQLAKRMGVKVFAMASGEDSIKLTNELGADVDVNGRNANIVESPKEFASARVGMRHCLLQAERVAGRPIPMEWTLNLMPPEGVDLQVFNMNSSPEVYEKLNSLIEEVPFNVHIARSFPLEGAAEAHRQLDDHYVGKYVLEVL